MQRRSSTALTWQLVACGGLLVASSAHAQSSACDQLKARLSTRIEANIRGFRLEVVAAGTQTPAGAKVIGNCDGGAYKVLLLRSGSTAVGTLEAASVPRTSTALSPTQETPTILAAATPTAATPKSPESTTPLRVPAQAPRPSPAFAPVQAVKATEDPAASAVPAMQVVVPISASAPPAESSASEPPALSLSSIELLHEYWPAIAALALTILATAAWVRIRRQHFYDTSGLPRGPKIRMK